MLDPQFEADYLAKHGLTKQNKEYQQYGVILKITLDGPNFYELFAAGNRSRLLVSHKAQEAVIKAEAEPYYNQFTSLSAAGHAHARQLYHVLFGRVYSPKIHRESITYKMAQNP